MADLGSLVLLVAFFALALVFIKGCERIIGPDTEQQPADADAVADSGSRRAA